jgi:hypothetical protein
MYSLYINQGYNLVREKGKLEEIHQGRRTEKRGKFNLYTLKQ